MGVCELGRVLLYLGGFAREILNFANTHRPFYIECPIRVASHRRYIFVSLRFEGSGKTRIAGANTGAETGHRHSYI